MFIKTLESFWGSIETTEPGLSDWRVGSKVCWASLRVSLASSRVWRAILGSIETVEPISETQPGKSTISALQNLLKKIKSSFKYKEYSLETFIDIAEAFDNTQQSISQHESSHEANSQQLYRTGWNILYGSTARGVQSLDSGNKAKGLKKY